MNKPPNHIAIIPDGNRRWAKRRAESFHHGHSEGAGNLMNIVRAAHDLGVKAVTFYLFSTENWTRAENEVQALMFLLEQYLIEQKQPMIDEGVRFKTIGNLSVLPARIQELIADVKQETAKGQNIDVVAALNYGSRDELLRAFQRMHKAIEKGDLKAEELSENVISSYLDTAPLPDPDLMIRCSGEFRLSNFLLWQLSYAEIYIADVLWPDFTPLHLQEAVKAYQGRERRLGGSL